MYVLNLLYDKSTNKSITNKYYVYESIITYDYDQVWTEIELLIKIFLL